MTLLAVLGVLGGNRLGGRSQAELLDAANKEAVFGLVTGVGALAALVANPLIGLSSDRTTSRFGRRHPWTLAGAVIELRRDLVRGLILVSFPLALLVGSGLMLLGTGLALRRTA